jgi:hypothetical protein
MPTNPPPVQAAHDDRGTFVVIGMSPYVAYAIHGTPAYLTRAAHEQDGTITLRPVGTTSYPRLDLAVDAGRWRAQREAHADSAEYECWRCGTPIALIGEAWVSVDYTTTAGGLSYCPPDPDAPRVGVHRPRRRKRA